MTDEELRQRHLDAQNDLNRFESIMNMMLLVFAGTFLFGITGLIILKVIL